MDDKVLVAKQRMRELLLTDLQTLYEAATALGDELHAEGIQQEQSGQGNSPLMVSLGFAYAFTFMIVRTLVDSGRIVLVKEHRDAIEAAKRLTQAIDNAKRSIH